MEMEKTLLSPRASNPSLGIRVVLLILLCSETAVIFYEYSGSDRRRGAVSSLLYSSGTPKETSCVKESSKTAKYTSLPSGWDRSGRDIYEAKKGAFTAAVTSNPDSVITHKILPLGPVKTTGDGFFKQRGFDGSAAPSWEPKTFQNFFNYMSSCRYYVGFGTWIGPTLFFAGQMAEEAFGIEADPAAYANVEVNLNLNHESAWAKRIHLHHHAVGIGIDTESYPVKVNMTSAVAGNSCSGLGQVACGKPRVRWEVNAYTLPALLKKWSVPDSNELFIKIDVESFECKLVPSWVPWMKSIEGPKPTFHLAFHSQIVKCSEAEYQDVYNFAKLFDIYDERCINNEAKTWDLRKCGSGEFIFRDYI